MKKSLFAALAATICSLAIASDTGIVYTTASKYGAYFNSNRHTIMFFDGWVSSTPDSKFGEFEVYEFFGAAGANEPHNLLTFQCPEQFQCQDGTAIFASRRAYFNRRPVVGLVLVHDSLFGPDFGYAAVYDLMTGNLEWERFGQFDYTIKNVSKIRVLCKD